MESSRLDFDRQAKQYLQLAATHKQNAGALALLGYIYCLGLAELMAASDIDDSQNHPSG